MVFMLDMKNPSSFFRPYYDILPPTLSNMPIFWQPQELAYLQGSFLLTQIDERKQAIEADYHAICNIAPEFGRLATLDEFKWARMCVCSRTFGLIINGLRTAALVPYADMLNHYRRGRRSGNIRSSFAGFHHRSHARHWQRYASVRQLWPEMQPSLPFELRLQR